MYRFACNHRTKTLVQSAASATLDKRIDVTLIAAILPIRRRIDKLNLHYGDGADVVVARRRLGRVDAADFTYGTAPSNPVPFTFNVASNGPLKPLTLISPSTALFTFAITIPLRQ